MQYPPPLLPLSSDEADSSPSNAGAFFSLDNLPVRSLPLRVAPLIAASATTLRPLASRVASSFSEPPAKLRELAASVGASLGDVGRVHSAGKWTDPAVHTAVAAALDAPLRPALRTGFEWYLCRGAFFHTDAHYPDVLFGVWYVMGPACEIVFPRAKLRVAAAPGALLVFDPFEVHGVLAPGAAAYRADDYVQTPTSVFVGFELELTDIVRSHFDMVHVPNDARIISSTTRVSAETGTFE